LQPVAQKKQVEKSNEKGHKRWTLWRHGTESDQDPDQHEVMSSQGAVMSSYSQEFKMEQVQVIIDEASTESPSPNSHSIVVAEWAAIRIQTAFRGFLVCLSIPSIPHAVPEFPIVLHEVRNTRNCAR